MTTTETAARYLVVALVLDDVDEDGEGATYELDDVYSDGNAAEAIASTDGSDMYAVWDDWAGVWLVESYWSGELDLNATRARDAR